MRKTYNQVKVLDPCLQVSIYFQSSILLLVTLLLVSNYSSAEVDYFQVVGKRTAEDEINNVAVSRNGQYVGVATQSYAYLYNAKGELLHEPPFKTLHFAWGAALSDKGLMVVGASNNIYLANSTGEVWHYYLRDDPNVRGEIKNLEVAVRAYDVAITPDGSYIAASVTPKYNFTKYLFFFNSTSSVPVWRLSIGQKVFVESVAISDDGNVIVAGMSDGSLQVYDKSQKIHGSYPLEPFTNEYEIKTQVDVSPDGDTIVGGNSKGTVFMFKRNGNLWNLGEEKLPTKQAFNDRSVASIALCSDYVVALSDTGVVQPFSRSEFDRTGDPLLQSYELSAKRGQAISVSDDCKFTVVAHGYVTEFVKTDFEKWPVRPSGNDAAPDTQVTTAVDGNNLPIKNGETAQSDMAIFEFLSPNSPAASFECSFDDSAFSPCKSPKIFHDLLGGDHSFQVRAVGASNNRDPTPDTYYWKVPGVDWITLLTIIGTVVAVIGTVVAIAHWRGWKFSLRRRERPDYPSE